MTPEEKETLLMDFLDWLQDAEHVDSPDLMLMPEEFTDAELVSRYLAARKA